jgi:hypothetical protein
MQLTGTWRGKGWLVAVATAMLALLVVVTNVQTVSRFDRSPTHYDDIGVARNLYEKTPAEKLLTQGRCEQELEPIARRVFGAGSDRSAASGICERGLAFHRYIAIPLNWTGAPSSAYSPRYLFTHPAVFGWCDATRTRESGMNFCS